MDTDRQLESSQLTVNDVLLSVASDKNGLSSKDAQERLERYGTNKLHNIVAAPAALLLRQFVRPVAMSLWLAAILLLLINNLWLATILALAALANTLAYFYQARGLQHYINTLVSLLAAKATVIRHGKRIDIDPTQIAIGDVLELRRGELVPADLRIIHSDGLVLDPANLSGESYHLHTTTGAIGRATSAFHAHNLALAGVSVIGGSGRGVAISTGTNTVLGRMISAHRLAHSQNEINLLARRLPLLAVPIIVFTAVAALALRLELSQFIVLAVTTIVALTPTAVTVASALSTNFSYVRWHTSAKSLRPLVQCATTDSIALAVLTFAGILAQLWLHIPLAATALQIAVFYLAFQLLLLTALGRESLALKSTHRKLSLTATIGFGTLAATAAYTNYLFFFVRHHVSPMFLATSSALYTEASSLALLTLIVCQFLNVMLARADRHERFFTRHLTVNKKLLVSFGLPAVAYIILVYSVSGAILTLDDWLCAFGFAAVYFGVRLTQRHTRKHSRKSVIELHQRLSELTD